MRFQFFGALGAPNCTDGECDRAVEAMPASGTSRIPAPRRVSTGATTVASKPKPPPPTAAAAVKSVSASKAAYLCVKETTAEDLQSLSELEAALQHAGYNPSKTLLDRYWTGDTESLPYREFHQILQVND